MFNCGKAHLSEGQCKEHQCLQERKERDSEGKGKATIEDRNKRMKREKENRFLFPN